MAEHIDVVRLEEPQAELERRLIDEYLQSTGHDPVLVRARSDDASRVLLTNASTYAASKLTEVECRSHYVRSLRGQE